MDSLILRSWYLIICIAFELNTKNEFRVPRQIWLKIQRCYQNLLSKCKIHYFDAHRFAVHRWVRFKHVRIIFISKKKNPCRWQSRLLTADKCYLTSAQINIQCKRNEHEFSMNLDVSLLKTTKKPCGAHWWLFFVFSIEYVHV